MQLSSLTKENKLLRENLQKQQKGAPVVMQDDKAYDNRESLLSGLDPANVESAENTPAKATETTSEISEACFSFVQIIIRLCRKK